jgi:hypothetical protein
MPTPCFRWGAAAGPAAVIGVGPALQGRHDFPRTFSGLLSAAGTLRPLRLRRLHEVVVEPGFRRAAVLRLPPAGQRRQRHPFRAGRLPQATHSRAQDGTGISPWRAAPPTAAAPARGASRGFAHANPSGPAGAGTSAAGPAAWGGRPRPRPAPRPGWPTFASAEAKVREPAGGRSASAGTFFRPLKTCSRLPHPGQRRAGLRDGPRRGPSPSVRSGHWTPRAPGRPGGKKVRPVAPPPAPGDGSA